MERAAFHGARRCRALHPDRADRGRRRSDAAGAKNLVLLLGADDTLVALDADQGKILWQKTFRNPLAPQRQATWLCANTAQDTPVVDRQKGLVYFIASDGKLRAAALADGAERMTPADFIAPFSRAWSLNLIDNVVYTTNARSCGNVVDGAIAAASLPVRGANGAITRLEPGSVSAMDVSDPAHPVVTHFYTSGGRQSGPWGRGGVAETPKGIVTQTADGLYDPAAGAFGDTLLALAPKAARLMDSFTPANQKYLLARDLDFSSGSPIVFAFAGKTVVATAGKEGILYLLDADAVGGGAPDHSAYLYKSPLLGNDEALGTQPGQGMWGAMATYRSGRQALSLYADVGAAVQNRAAVSARQRPDPQRQHHGVPARRGSGENLGAAALDLAQHDRARCAGGGERRGLRHADRRADLAGDPRGAGPAAPAGRSLHQRRHLPRHAGRAISSSMRFDARDRQEFYSSKKTIPGWTHFSEPVVALGKVFVVTHDARVYAFGLK